MPLAQIIGTGSYAPAQVITNQDLEKIVDTSDAWITERTGIQERRQGRARRGDQRHGGRGRPRGAGDGRRRARRSWTSSSWAPSRRTCPCRPARCSCRQAGREEGLRLRRGRRVRRLAVRPDRGGPVHALRPGASGRSSSARSCSAGAGELGGPQHLRPLRRRGGRHGAGAHAGGRGAASSPPTCTRTARWRTSSPSPRAARRSRMTEENVREQAEQAAHERARGLQVRGARADGHHAGGAGVHGLTPGRWTTSSRTRPTCASSRPCCSDWRFPIEKCWINLHKYGNTSSASVPMTLDEAHRAGGSSGEMSSR